MTTAIWIAVGGAVGSLSRFAISESMNGKFHPWGTVLVNVVGSLALGYLVGRWGIDDPSAQRLGITVGLLGGFTTFSTFSIDAIRIWENGHGVTAAAMVIGTVVVGIGAASLGVLVGRG